MGSIYHYTDLNAVVNILNQLKLRATEIRYLNDSTEFVDGKGYIKEEVDRVSALHLGESRVNVLSSLRLLQGVASHRDQSVTYGTVMVTSFSRAYDQLSQWRGYGLYCIEFDEGGLGEHLPLHKCVYEPNEKRSLAALSVREGLAKLSTYFEAKPEIPHVSVNEPYEIAEVVEAKAAIFKHEGFAEEQEVRAVFEMWKHYYPEDLKHRVRADMIVPFIERPIPAKSIKSITVGPMNNQAMAIASLTSFLQCWQDDPAERKGVPIFHDIVVKGSLVPFRSA